MAIDIAAACLSFFGSNSASNLKKQLTTKENARRKSPAGVEFLTKQSTAH
jgi:hypothetical protein